MKHDMYFFGNMVSGNQFKNDRAENDFYATAPYAVDDLLRREALKDTILEPSVGMGHIADRLKAHGKKVIGIDIVNRGWEGTIVQDFLTYDEKISCDVVMNPPYKVAQKHIEKVLHLAENGVKICAFLKVQFLESIERQKLFSEYKPCRIYVYSKRAYCAKNGVFLNNMPRAMMFCWFIWEKGNHDNPPQLFWI